MANLSQSELRRKTLCTALASWEEYLLQQQVGGPAWDLASIYIQDLEQSLAKLRAEVRCNRTMAPWRPCLCEFCGTEVSPGDNTCSRCM